MIRDLMVHLDGSAEDRTRLAHAEAVRDICPGSRLTGLYTNPLPEYAMVLGVGSGLANIEPVQEMERQVRRLGDDTEVRLDARIRRPDGTSELRRLDAGPSRLPDLAAAQARWADLFVATLPRLSEGYPWNALFDAVLFEGGHPVFAVPPGAPVRSAIRTVLVAWNDTAQAARAVAGAMPLLKAATRVVAFVVNEGWPGDDRGVVDLGAHLVRHGVRSEVKVTRGSAPEVAALIQEESGAISADLIVMGAYGHSRLREWALGGATFDVVDAAQVPLLLAH